MTAYIIRRLIQVIPVIFGVTIMVFIITRVGPGDPARIYLGPKATPEQVDAMRDKLGLNEPFLIQYGIWLKQIIQGDFGTSIMYRRDVKNLLLVRGLASIELMGTALLISIIIGVATGVVCAVKQYSIFDHISRVLALFFVSMADFLLGLILILIFALYLNWFPTSGAGSVKHLVLPAFALGLRQMALISRLTRSSMLDVIRQDYVTTARAKGVKEFTVICKHALRNALIPIVTIIGLRIPWLFGGAVVTETVFAWPGMGRLLVLSTLNRDFPIVQAAVLIIAILVIFSNLAVDITYSFINPQIRYD